MFYYCFFSVTSNRKLIVKIISHIYAEFSLPFKKKNHKQLQQKVFHHYYYYYFHQHILSCLNVEISQCICTTWLQLWLERLLFRFTIGADIQNERTSFTTNNSKIAEIKGRKLFHKQIKS